MQFGIEQRNGHKICHRTLERVSELCPAEELEDVEYFVEMGAITMNALGST